MTRTQNRDRIVFVSLCAFAGVLLGACAKPVALTPNDNPDYEVGQSVRRMIELQNLPQPRHADGLEFPMTGLDGNKASLIIRNHRQRVAPPNARPSGNVTINVGAPQ